MATLFVILLTILALSRKVEIMTGIVVLALYLSCYAALATVVANQQPLALHVVTADEMLELGLAIGGFSTLQVQRASRKTNVDRFVGKYGSKPLVLCKIWEDLQTTTNVLARIDPSKDDLSNFLSSMWWIKQYPTEEDRTSFNGRSRTTLRKWGWYFMKKLQAMKAQKVRWYLGCVFFGQAILFFTCILMYF